MKHFARKLSPCVAVLVSYVALAAGFLPNPFSAISVNDYTHTDITELGILQAVAEFFEEHKIQSCTQCKPGGLTSIPDLTARKLFDAYYGGEQSEKLFQQTIDDIVIHNNKVDQNHYADAVWHFDGEQIREESPSDERSVVLTAKRSIVQTVSEDVVLVSDSFDPDEPPNYSVSHQYLSCLHTANTKMQGLRDHAIQILNVTNPNFDAAREAVGQFLHLLQDFYSNTNWVEMSGSVVYKPLGISGMSIMPTAPPSIDTCRSCGPSLHTSCTTNLMVSSNFLTSGYKSGQAIKKPMKDPSRFNTGKCSYGGPRDTSAMSAAAVGGINKASMNAVFSPHANLHEKAAETAIKHTAYFFGDKTVGLRGVVGDGVFQDLLLLRSGSSLVFVIDTTGSMGKDLAAVQTKTAEIVRETAGTSNAPYNYILVTFNDPGNATTIQKTKNATDIQRWLGDIRVHGGDDCPEFSLTGIQAASTVAQPNSQVFVFTDATPKDADKINFITSLIAEKKLRVQFLVTGTCKTKRANI